jgi:lantibiotic modifying enzyme
MPVDSTSILSAGGERIDNYYALSGWAACLRRLETLGDDDLARETWAIESALTPALAHIDENLPEPQLPTQSARDIRSEDLVEAALRIGRIVLAQARRLERGLVWPGLARRFDLYEGQPGIAVFLAALFAQTGANEWRAAAQDALSPLRNALASTEPSSQPIATHSGAVNGLGSLLLALRWSARFLQDEEIFAQSARCALRLTPAVIMADPHLDVAGGAAGAALALIDARASMDNEAWRESVNACARRLIETQAVTGPESAAWPGADNLSRAGFAHGAAGIALALARIYTITTDRALLAPIRQALTHERRMFDPRTGNWPVLRPGGEAFAMTAWCHGAPGIGLARACMPDALVDAETAVEIDAALRATLAAPPHRYDHLCCGNLGRSDALLTISLLRGDIALGTRAHDMAKDVARRVIDPQGGGARPADCERRPQRAGLFQGLAGIGYQLLRTAAPARFPSLLSLSCDQKEP